MAASDELQQFVRDSLSRGLPRAEIEAVLLAAGWPADQVRGALAGFAEVEFPVPVPRPAPYLSAFEAFLYLVLFSTLYASAFHLGALVFQLVDRAFPDPAEAEWVTGRSREAIRWAVSTLVVAFPVFLYVSSRVSRRLRLDPSKRASKIRKWLTYVTLFLAACVLIGDVTSLVYRFLGGELTTRFVLKAATVGAIAGSIFGYYLWDLRRDEEEKEIRP